MLAVAADKKCLNAKTSPLTGLLPGEGRACYWGYVVGVIVLVIAASSWLSVTATRF